MYVLYTHVLLNSMTWNKNGRYDLRGKNEYAQFNSKWNGSTKQEFAIDPYGFCVKSIENNGHALCTDYAK